MTSKFKFLYSSLLTICSTLLLAQGPFERVYEAPRDRALRDVVRTPDGYMLCGWTNTADPTENDLLVMRTDINGNELPGWPKIYGHTGVNKVDFAYNMAKTDDGNYIIIGYTSGIGQGFVDIYFLKIDIDGNKLIEKTFGSFGFDEGREIIRTNDGNFVIVGTHTENSNQQACLVKVDQSGTPVWNPPIKSYGTSAIEYGNAVQESPDGSLILVGQTMQSDVKGDIYIVKTGSDGSFQWDKTTGKIEAQECTGLVINADGSFVVAIRDSTAASDIDVRINKFDSQGNQDPQYDKVYGGPSKDTPKAIVASKDGLHYYVSAISRSWNWRGNSDPDAPDMWLLKLKAADGDTVYTRNYGGRHNDHLERVRMDPVDDAILLCGHSVGQPYVKKPYFLKLNIDGFNAPFVGIDEVNMSAKSTIFPNPTEGKLQLILDKDISDAKINISNYLGQDVYKQEHVTLSADASHIIDLSKEQPGMYLMTIQTANSLETKKVIIK